jgi:hypothetical protein
MSLRGSETTEAISQSIGNKEIATLPSVARNDKRGLRHSLIGEGARVKGEKTGKQNLSITLLSITLEEKIPLLCKPT